MLKKLLAAAALILALGFAQLPAWAATNGACVSVAATAGGTPVVPQGNHYVEWAVNTGGTQPAFCTCDGLTPTTSNWQFQLAINGGTWMPPQITYAPNEIGAGSPRLACQGGVSCITSTSTTNVCYYAR